MKKCLIALGLLALSIPAMAADQAVKAIHRVAVASTPPLCTTNQCSVIFAGPTIMGMGSNVDIIGQGISNSIFADGGMAGVSVGGQYWYQGIFLGLENMAGYAFGAPASVNGTGVNLTGGLDVLWFEAGGSLGDLFGSGATPVSINNALASDLISLYFGTGPGVPLGNSSLGTQSFWTSGAGARYLLPTAATSWPIMLDIKYIYGNNQNSTGLATNKNVQFVGAGIYVPIKF
jgi:hypothetical protein